MGGSLNKLWLQDTKIPQVDGPSSSGSDSPSPPTFAPRSQHPSLPQPPPPTSAPVDNEAINSDLDDSDSEEEEDAQEDGPGDGDIVFCTYDKVLYYLIILRSNLRCVSGRPCKEQVEVYSEGWNDSRERKGLSICQMHRVRTVPHVRARI